MKLLEPQEQRIAERALQRYLESAYAWAEIVSQKDARMPYSGRPVTREDIDKAFATIHDIESTLGKIRAQNEN